MARPVQEVLCVSNSTIMTLDPSTMSVTNSYDIASDFEGASPILGRDENSQEFKFSSKYRASILTELHRIRWNRSTSTVAEFPVLHLRRRNLEWIPFSLVAGGCVPEKLPTALIQLRNLNLIDFSFETRDEVLFVLCLLRSAPNLRRFTMEFDSHDSGEGLEKIIEDCLDISLNQLKEVAFHNASGSPPELEFIKLLLAKSPKLEGVLIESISMDATLKMNILVKLVRFKRVSTAEIIFV